MSKGALVVTCVLVAVGIALRVRQYVTRKDLWLDEAWLAENIVTRDWHSLLFTPLINNQVAPPGFLQAAKLSTTVFGMSEHALRLPAFISSIIALILFVVVSAKLMRDWETPVATLLMAISPMLILQGSEFKQYSSDLLIGLLLTYIVIRWRESGYSNRWSLITALLPLLLVFFSDASVLMLGGLGIALIVLALRERDRSAMRAAIIAAPAWLIAVAIEAWAAAQRVSPHISQTMYHYWHTAFFPIVPRSIHDSLWLPWSLRLLYRDGFGLRYLVMVPLILMVLGIYSMWRSNRRDGVLLLFGPVLVTLLASGAQLYPFRERLVLFLLPPFAFAFAAGIMLIVGRLKSWSPPAALALTLVLLEPEVFQLHIRGMYLRREEIKPVLAHIAAQRRPDDAIYVAWPAVAAVTFYAPRFGFRPSDWYGSPWAGNDHWDLVFKDIDRFRGAKRLWVVFSHDDPRSVRDRIVSHLDSLATPVPDGDYPGRDRPRIDASAFLYDLKPKDSASLETRR